MSPVTRLCAAFALSCALLSGNPGSAKEAETADTSSSPYFLIAGGDPDVDRLPLKSTFADVSIAGVIAEVKVTQVYRNEGRHPIEAVYVFPASTRAAVHAMKMTIGDRVIVATVKRRDDARREYEQAKGQGRSASLLEQQRPNVFQMNVANILPGDEIRVELDYTELLVPTNKEYELVYPAVVGPRYSNREEAAASATERWIGNPYLHQGTAPTYSFGINVHIAAGMPVQKIASPSHRIAVRYEGTTGARIGLDRSETAGGNRDFILKYRLAGEAIETGLLLTEGEKEKFFLLMLQPPHRVRPEQIPGREYIFIVDVSGSMHGYPLDISKKLLKDLIGNLRPSDTFNVLLFAGGNSVLSERSLPATKENISRAISVIDNQQGGGGTELLPALKRALAIPRDQNVSRSVIIATDGYVSVEAEAFDLIRSSLDSANLFAFGIGTSVNRHLIEGMARAGMGEPFVITKQEEASVKAEAFRTLVQSPVLTRVRTEYNGFDVYDVEPLSVPDVLADRPVIIFGKWRGTPAGTITVSGRSGEGAYREELRVSAVTPSAANNALRYLWARHRIALLSDYEQLRADDRRGREVTELGLAYNLLTNYTSFVAVDTEVRNREGTSSTVHQPLPLPAGVSDHAVGGGFALSSPVPAAKLLSRSKPAAQEDASEPAAAVRERKATEQEDPRGKVLTIRDVRASGGAASDDIRRYVERHLEALAACIGGMTLKGKITVTLTIDARGIVTRATAASQDIKGTTFLRCLERAIRGWTVDVGTNGAATQVTMTIVAA